MLRVLAVICGIVFLFSGCGDYNHISEEGMALREKLSEGCSFTAHIVADFAETTYSFTMNCTVDKSGELKFEVISPESIAGICGSVSSSGGKLTFDDAVLVFPLLADGELSPVCAPWLCVRTLLSGYMRSSADEGERTRLTIDDSFSGENLQADIWVSKNGFPEYAEFLWNNHKILSVRFENFKFV